MVLRSTGLMVVEVIGGNPNGDPDDNRPRMMTNGHCWFTDVSVKAKARQLLADHNLDFFREIVKKFSLSADRFHIFESLRRGTNYHDGDYTGEDAIKAKNELMALAENDPAALMDLFWDIRIFGANLLEQGASSSEEDENGKKKKMKQAPGKRFIRGGPVTISPAISVAPVVITEATLTKRFCLRDEVLGKLQSDMAPYAKKFLEHGLFTACISVNPNAAKATGLTDVDVEVFKEVIKHIFTFTTSCSRQAGTINIEHIWWADHDNVLGSFNDFEFWKLLKPYKKTEPDVASVSLDDYVIPTPESVGLKYKVVDLMAR